MAIHVILCSQIWEGYVHACIIMFREIFKIRGGVAKFKFVLQSMLLSLGGECSRLYSHVWVSILRLGGVAKSLHAEYALMFGRGKLMLVLS